MAAFRRSEDPDDWKRLMSEHLVRRTRTFIKNNLRADRRREGQSTSSSPTAADSVSRNASRRPIDHSFGENDPAALMAGDATLDTITALRLPRYELGNYLVTDGVADGRGAGVHRQPGPRPRATSPVSSAPPSTSGSRPAATRSRCR